jgi:hypothetical protein
MVIYSIATLARLICNDPQELFVKPAIPHSLLYVCSAMVFILFLQACGQEEQVPASSPPVLTTLSEKPAAAVPVTPEVPPAPVIVPPPAPTVAPAPAPAPAPAVKTKYKAGEDPDYARSCGWPVVCAAQLPGAILPAKRIVAYYGNPQSKRMGALGEFEKDDMLRRLNAEVLSWEKADPAKPVQPALHLIAVVAQSEPGKAGKYRMIMPDVVVNRVYGWAQEAQAVMFIDIQTGHDDIRAILPRFEWILKNPDVHLGIDPEFNLIASGVVPGKKVGTYDAADINYVTEYLASLVKTYDLPPKVLTVHRFTRKGVSNADKIVLRPEVQIVMHMDGWGAPWLKRDTYKDYIVKEPVQYTGFKLFYHNDTKKGDPLLTPPEILRLNPQPVYIQYQ